MALPDGPPKASGQKLVKAKKTPQNNVTPLKTVKKSWKKIFDKLKGKSTGILISKKKRQANKRRKEIRQHMKELRDKLDKLTVQLNELAAQLNDLATQLRDIGRAGPLHEGRAGTDGFY
ncbi:hypothetical protein SLS57_001129 [Botryosphaeria dothidea]